MDSQSKENFIIRAPTKEDLSFIYSTWLKSFRYSSTFAKEIDNEIYYKYHELLIERILNSPLTTIFVAVDANNPEVIFGYAVEQMVVLHFVYVKKSFRGMGVGTRLFECCPGIKYITHLTKDSKKFLLKNPQVRYNPYVAS